VRRIKPSLHSANASAHRRRAVTELPSFDLDPRHDVVDFLAINEDVNLTNCDREPIHLSGAIQPHGALLAVREDDLNLRVCRTSSNAESQLGKTPWEILGAPLDLAVGADLVARLRLALDDPRASGSDPLIGHLPTGDSYEMTWHRIDGMVIVELEPAEVPASVSMSTLFADVRQAMQAMESAKGVQELCAVAAAEIKRLTGYDRVMVYRFHADDHGEVVAEEREPDQEPFLGLHYPAGDIPRQARKLFLLNRLRVIADVDYQPAALLGTPDTDNRVNLSLSSLRSVSPFHIAYLQNMGVRASMTISLIRGTALWGMLACHHLSPKRIDAQQRAACRLLGQVFSLQLVAQENAERQGYRAELAQIEAQVVAHMSSAKSIAAGMIAMPDSALALTAAEGLVGRIDGQTVQAGIVPPAQAIGALIDILRLQEAPEALICDDLPHRYPELATFAEQASGVVAMSLSGIYDDFVMWFRGERIQNLTWAENPDKTSVSAPEARPAAEEPAELNPIRSFEAWAQEVRGRSQPWLQAEVDTAQLLAESIPALLLARARDHLAYLALHDPLTGLPNRAQLFNHTVQALARQQRRDGQVAVLYIDLDRFKLVNDSLGHGAGDTLLIQASQRLLGVTRLSDTVARMSGDEFVVLCEGITYSQGEHLGDRIVAAFEQPFDLDGQPATVTASVGIAFAEPRATPASLLRDADTAMYRAKKSGRSGVARFTTDMHDITLHRLEIETQLRPALEHGELELAYQPIHNSDGVLTGFEALARWPLASRGMVPPSEFIPIAEESGLIQRLTEWALDEGLAALAGWRQDHPELDLTLAVNIAASQTLGSELERTIDLTLDRHGLPAQALCLEITESALVTSDARSHQFLRRLRDQGVRLSIDDFGTGYSSLSYLTKLPVHELKIDRAFISGLPQNMSDVTVVASVVGLAHQLGLKVLAEGVETDDQLATVRRLGCDLFQGYLNGRPMTADDVDRLLLSRT
jgi:diguanylate cyclase (GGDEF)-like protein